MGALVRTSAPSVEPVTTAEAKAHCRIDSSDEDSYIDLLIELARDVIEDETSRRLITQTYKWKLNNWPLARRLDFPVLPIQSVTSIVYTDREGTSTTFATSNYIVDIDSEPARIVLKSGVLWPLPSLSLLEANAIVITFVAGYGDAASDVPERLKHAMKMIISHVFENREETIPTAIRVEELPLGVQRLIRPFGAWNEWASAPISAENWPDNA